MLAKIKIYAKPTKKYEVKDEEILLILRDLLEAELHVVDNVTKAIELFDSVSKKANSLRITYKQRGRNKR